MSKPIDTTQLFQKISYWIKNGQATIQKIATMGETTTHSSTKGTLAIKNQIILKLAGIDAQTGLNRLGGNQNLYFKLLVMFYENHKHAIKKIRYALKHGDLNDAIMLVHAIKGAAGNLSAQDAYLEASALEAKFRANRLDDVELLLAQLENALEQTFGSISLLEKDVEDIKNLHPGVADISIMKPILINSKIYCAIMTWMQWSVLRRLSKRQKTLLLLKRQQR